MRWQVIFSLRGDQNVETLQYLWADTFTTKQSVLSRRLPPERRITNFEGVVTDITLLVTHLTTFGMYVLDVRFGPKE